MKDLTDDEYRGSEDFSFVTEIVIYVTEGDWWTFSASGTYQDGNTLIVDFDGILPYKGEDFCNIYEDIIDETYKRLEEFDSSTHISPDRQNLPPPECWTKEDGNMWAWTDPKHMIPWQMAEA